MAFSTDGESLMQAETATGTASGHKPVVIGVYGVPGAGKSWLLDRLKPELGKEHFTFYEGSQMIASLVPGGLGAFQRLEEHEKSSWRQIAIDTIGRQCAESRKVGLVTGHFMFWAEDGTTGKIVCTPRDLEVFTHILYLDVPADILAERRQYDNRRRPSLSMDHLRQWQKMERFSLPFLCSGKGVLFMVVCTGPTLPDQVSKLVQDFRQHHEKYNLSRAECQLDKAVLAAPGRLKKMLVFDGDRTLAAEDTGALFWASHARRSGDDEDPLKTVFSSPLGYSYTAFRQATLLYEEATNDGQYEAICEEVSSAVTIYPEFVSLLKRVEACEFVGALVVTCGLRRVWEKVLEREGLSETVKVIGGGRISGGYVVTGEVKAALVARLKETHHISVWAFGDGPLDLGMFKKADEAIVVVGEEKTRSQTMDKVLTEAIDEEDLQARQLVLAPNAPPRLDTTKLPLIDLADGEFFNGIFERGPGRHQATGLRLFLATDRNASKLLATAMRDAAVAGPVLREAHRRAGFYLATEFVTNVIGLEECPIQHVLGRTTSGYRLLSEQRTTIVALMRAGEPMALGVSDAFPQAMFLHASRPEDIKLHHVQEQETVLLVDSVINSGQTIVEFFRAVRNLHPTIRVVVVAGVLQAQSITEGSLINEALGKHDSMSLVGLRVSETKFTGSGATDTGNRLFNTTGLP
ncbi:MAG: hypothetical protein M1823_000883 [Watsoniomyces obsoletus]|nr:MAG: hypothetical protein M1823_000883 [Watsoniomyces obsoletus]